MRPNANATATAQTSHNHATATALAQQNATATVVAQATAMATSPYKPFTTVALDSPLTSASSGCDSSTICQFSSTGYQVSIQQANTLQFCRNSGQYGEIAYQATMTITQGDCGGLTFRYNDNNNFYFFEVCVNGTYDVGYYVNGQPTLLYPNFHTSSAIKQGLNQPNTLAITVQGDTVNMFINGSTSIDAGTSSSLTGSTFSQGQIGLFAEDAGDPTTVVYTNALVWTIS